MCSDGFCAFRNANQSCKDSGVIVGTWEADDIGNYYLKSCPAGYSLRNESGEVFSYGAQRCHPCLSTEYIIHPNSQDCITCPEGLKCQGDDVVVKRVPDSEWDLVDGQYVLTECPLGYLFVTTTPRAQKCAACPLGYECTEIPCLECTACEPGTYKDTIGAGSCDRCDLDTFNPIYAATSSAECIACPLYATTAKTGSIWPRDCVCAMSTYIMDEQYTNTTGAWCMECPIGGECDGDICAFRMPDLVCPRGKQIIGNWSRESEGGIFRLSSCPSGYSLVNSLDGTSTGFFWHGSQQCAKCEPGQAYILHPNNDTCQRCPPGLFQVHQQCDERESATDSYSGMICRSYMLRKRERDSCHARFAVVCSWQHILARVVPRRPLCLQRRSRRV